jgi:hypothetical protein
MDNGARKREFLHTVSRMTDRFGAVVRDCSRIVNDQTDLKRAVLELQEDVIKLQQALEGFFNDLLKESNQ